MSINEYSTNEYQPSIAHLMSYQISMSTQQMSTQTNAMSAQQISI